MCVRSRCWRPAGAQTACTLLRAAGVRQSFERLWVAAIAATMSHQHRALSRPHIEKCWNPLARISPMTGSTACLAARYLDRVFSPDRDQREPHRRASGGGVGPELVTTAAALRQALGSTPTCDVATVRLASPRSAQRSYGPAERSHALLAHLVEELRLGGLVSCPCGAARTTR